MLRSGYNRAAPAPGAVGGRSRADPRSLQAPPTMNRLFRRAIDLCPLCLWIAAAAYLALQPTPAATYGKSVAFGVAGYFTIVIVIATAAGWRPRIPSPGAFLLIALGVWSLWAGASWGGSG